MGREPRTNGHRNVHVIEAKAHRLLASGRVAVVRADERTLVAEVEGVKVAKIDNMISALCSNLREVVRQGNTTKEAPMSASAPASTRKPAVDLSALSAQLITEVKKAFPGVELTQKKSYVRAHLGRVTVGYLYPSANGGKSAVETILPDGSGKYAYHRVSTAAELKKAIAAMRAVEKRAAKKAAAVSRKAAS